LAVNRARLGGASIIGRNGMIATACRRLPGEGSRHEDQAGFTDGGLVLFEPRHGWHGSRRKQWPRLPGFWACIAPSSTGSLPSIVRDHSRRSRKIGLSA